MGAPIAQRQATDDRFLSLYKNRTAFSNYQPGEMQPIFIIHMDIDMSIKTDGMCPVAYKGIRQSDIHTRIREIHTVDAGEARWQAAP